MQNGAPRLRLKMKAVFHATGLKLRRSGNFNLRQGKPLAVSVIEESVSLHTSQRNNLTRRDNTCKYSCTNSAAHIFIKQILLNIKD